MATADYAAPLPNERRMLPPFVAPLIVVVVAVLAQLVASGGVIDDYALNITVDVGVAVIMAVSLNIVNGYTGQFSIGHAAFYSIGAYAAASITYYGSLLLFDSPVLQSTWAGWSGQTGLFLLALAVSALAAGLAGWIVGLPSLRLKGDYLAIVTLGFGEIVRILLQQTNHQIDTKAELLDAPIGKLLPPPLGGSLGFTSTPKFTNLFWIALFVGVTLLVAWRLKKSTFGRSMIGIRENEIAAESMGVNVTRLKVWAFVIGAAFAGVAGCLKAHKFGTTITPDNAGFVESFNIVIMVVLGGLGSISGAALAAVLYVVAQQWLLDPTHVWHAGLFVLAVRLIVWPSGDLKAIAWRLAILLAGVAFYAWAVTVDLAGLPPAAVPAELGRAAIFVALAAVAIAKPPGGWTSDRGRALIWGVALIAGAELLWAAAYGAGVSLGDYRIVLFALILILVMILRPGGLFGTHEISDLPRMRRHTGEEVPT